MYVCRWLRPGIATVDPMCTCAHGSDPASAADVGVFCAVSRQVQEYATAQLRHIADPDGVPPPPPLSSPREAQQQADDAANDDGAGDEASEGRSGGEQEEGQEEEAEEEQEEQEEEGQEEEEEEEEEEGAVVPAAGSAAAAARRSRAARVAEFTRRAGRAAEFVRVLGRTATEGDVAAAELIAPFFGWTPPPRTKWTRRVPHPVLIGHAASLTPY